MEEIYKSSKLNQWNQVIENSSKLSSQMSEIIKTQDRLTKSFSGISMASEIAKNMKQYSIKFDNPALSAIEAMSKAITLKTENIIPKTTIDAIASINQQHEKLFSGLTAMTESLKIQSPVLAQFNNLSFALSAVSKQVAAIAAQQKDWTIIDDFEEINAKTIEFSESLTEEVTEEQQNIFQKLLALISTFAAEYGVNGLRIINLIMLFASIYQY